MIELAKEEAKAFKDESSDLCEENVFQPPRSPVKTKKSLDILKEVVNIEAAKLQKERIEEKRKALKLLPSSQEGAYSLESDLKSFNDFDETLFQLNEETKKFKCPHPDCDKEFPSLSRIKRHFIIHTDIKPFKCENPGCNKTFSRKDNMLQHYRVHCPYGNGVNKKRGRNEE